MFRFQGDLSLSVHIVSNHIYKSDLEPNISGRPWVMLYSWWPSPWLLSTGSACGFLRRITNIIWVLYLVAIEPWSLLLVSLYSLSFLCASHWWIHVELQEWRKREKRNTTDINCSNCLWGSTLLAFSEAYPHVVFNAIC